MRRQAIVITLCVTVGSCCIAIAGDYSIVDTGQTGCYDDWSQISAPASGQAFYGQDAQHAGNAPSYTVSGDGLTVYDNVTGLTWTKKADWDNDGVVDVDDKFTYTEALAYVATLNAQNYGGFNDWRVPTTKQLYSLIDFRGTDPDPMASGSSGLTPFIDDDTFQFAYGDTSVERVIDSQWVVSTLYTGTVMNGQTAMFGVNFADGRIKGYPAYGGTPNGDKTFYARFVRGNEAYGTNSFTDNGDGTITDSATGLMWAQSDNGTGVDWETALAWAQQCNAANYLGHDDWRLPNAKELHSIVDYTRSPDATGSAAIDPLFNATQIINLAGQTDYGFYWSSTTFLRFDGSASSAVYVAFGRGLGSMDGVNVIDVHGAGCQRSDPKTGDPADYPMWGFGPQGDVRRVFNFVRLVRNATATTGLLGDFTGDGVVNTADYTFWADNFGGSDAALAAGSHNNDGVVNQAEYTIWADHFGDTAGLSVGQSVAPAATEPTLEDPRAKQVRRLNQIRAQRSAQWERYRRMRANRRDFHARR